MKDKAKSPNLKLIQVALHKNGGFISRNWIIFRRGRTTARRSASPFAEQTLRNGCSGGRFTHCGVTIRTLVTGPNKQLHYQSSVVLQIREKKETRT